MADKKVGAVSEYKDDSYYVVELARAVQVGPTWLRPGHTHRMKGSFLKTLLSDKAVAGSVNVTGEATDGRPAA